jgi:hypothetical protein
LINQYFALPDSLSIGWRHGRQVSIPVLEFKAGMMQSPGLGSADRHGGHSW